MLDDDKKCQYNSGTSTAPQGINLHNDNLKDHAP